MHASARSLGAPAAALAAAALTAAVIARAWWYGQKVSSAFACPRRLAKPRHYALQAWFHWKLRLGLHEATNGFLKPVEQTVVDMVKKRVETSDSIVEVYTECKCGACRISVAEGGPLITCLCHCSMCRSFNFHKGYRALPFAVVKRAACRLQGGGPEARIPGIEARIPLVWFYSSEMLRRARCGTCGSPLLFDGGWVQPRSMWLANPIVRTRGADGELLEVAAEDFFGGTYDLDVCWSSRHEPVEDVSARMASDSSRAVPPPEPKPTAHGTSHRGGSADGRGGPDADDDDGYPLAARGRHGDFSWNKYFLDPGRL